MKIVILAGGLGTRLSEETECKPKPMVEIGGRPILWHIMKIYAAGGFNEFVLALGYKGEVIKQYFLNYYHLQNDFSIELANGKIDVHEGAKENWKIDFIDTGLNTGTGGRLRRLSRWIDGTFMMTYGDGVSDIAIKKLLAFHRQHKKLATITAVHPPSRFGAIEFKNNKLIHFNEKPQTGEGWINGGFFILEKKVLDYIDDDSVMFEKEPLERLARKGQLVAYHHENFWQYMDTQRDMRLLENLWANDEAPWKIWKD